MKRTLSLIALTCILSVSAMAVDMPTCGITSEEPPTTEIEGSIPTGDVANPVSVELIMTLLGIVT